MPRHRTRRRFSASRRLRQSAREFRSSRAAVVLQASSSSWELSLLSRTRRAREVEEMASLADYRQEIVAATQQIVKSGIMTLSLHGNVSMRVPDSDTFLLTAGG